MLLYYSGRVEYLWQRPYHTAGKASHIYCLFLYWKMLLFSHLNDLAHPTRFQLWVWGPTPRQTINATFLSLVISHPRDCYDSLITGIIQWHQPINHLRSLQVLAQRCPTCQMIKWINGNSFLLYILFSLQDPLVSYFFWFISVAPCLVAIQ